jgi:hypothetical protein
VRAERDTHGDRDADQAMAGLSLECGDCKVQLRSVEEAQDHAELTGHTNFQESTQAVSYMLFLSCSTPPFPCDCLSNLHSEYMRVFCFSVLSRSGKEEGALRNQGSFGTETGK